MRIVVADDEASVRSALRLLLEQDPRVTTISEAGAAECLLGRAEATRPDVVFLDWDLPGLNPSQALTALRALVTHLVVIALSSRPEERHAALAEGVDAFVCKGDAPDHLLSTLRRCLAVWPG